MNLNHINIVVTNVAAGITFFEKYFGFKCIETKGDNIVAVLRNSEGFTLVIMKSKDSEPQYPQAFHIGFMQESAQAVSYIHSNLKSDGIDVGDAPKNIRDSFGFYFTFESIMIEVGHYFNQ